MATIRVYYKRFSDINYNDYNLFYFAGNGVYGDDAKLFPDIDLDIQNPYGPRSKEDFTVDSGLGYVDIEMNTSKKVAFYIRRKDFRFDYNGEYDEGLNLEDDSLNEYKYEVGYVWEIDLNIAPYDTFYVNNESPYLFKNSSYTEVVPQGIGVSGNSAFDKTDDPLEKDNGGHDGGEGIDQGDTTHLNIFLSKGEALIIPKTEEMIYLPQADGTKESNIREVLMLYLRGKLYDIGENMQLSIDQAALDVEKADALDMVDKAIANSLYKLGEDIEDFDEDAFQADVSGYKASKSDSMGPVADYLNELLNTRSGLV